MKYYTFTGEFILDRYISQVLGGLKLGISLFTLPQGA